MNYIRNSVKVTINAYDGSMKFYIADREDPVIRTISNIFPGTLQSLSEMPADLKRHIRYPLDIFSIQTHMYSTYHMEDPQMFYNKETSGRYRSWEQAQKQRLWNLIIPS